MARTTTYRCGLLFRLASLWVGRALIGVGVSSCLMAAMKAYRSWYAPEKQSQLASWMLVSGTLGALSSTVPVARAANTAIRSRKLQLSLSGRAR